MLAKIAQTMLNLLGLLDLRALLGLLCFAGLRTLCLTRSLAKLASVTQTMLGLLGLLDLRRLRLARSLAELASHARPNLTGFGAYSRSLAFSS